ncbi:MAG: peptide chain release factor 1 [Bacteroidia bacterium]|nr:peptide chain release factor 1 [Bacteroidia bacterium]
MNDNVILDKLASINIKFNEIGEQLTNPEVISDMKRFISLSKEYRNLEPLIQSYKIYIDSLSNIQSAKEIIANEKDEEMRDMAKAELEELTLKITGIEEEIKILMLPKDPEDFKNAILEIRAGTGGDEASIFAGDLYRMYNKYCENKKWKVEVTSFSEGTVGGYKELICKVTGDGVYGILKYESGVHRVQRVPQTETQGRVHTSAATIAVLPEAEEFDIVVNQNDIKKETFCSSGPGGQSVNTTYSAVRLTHIPTGIVVSCQDEKSQIKNNEKAMGELRTRIYNMEYQKHMDKIAAKRKTMVSTGDRSAKIRTYNYPQNRVTDHRINLTLYNLDAVINGDIDELISKLQMAENAEKMKESEI